MVVGAVDGSAMATTTPSVTWSFRPTSLTSGQHPYIAYTERSMSTGQRLLVQRVSSNRWVTLAQLHPKANGTGSYLGAAVSQGRYQFRLIIVNASSRGIASQARILYVYGTVPFSKLAPTQAASIVQVGGKSFTYVWHEASWERATVLTLASTTCRSMSMSMAYLAAPSGTAANGQSTADLATLQVLQSTPSADTANVASGTTAGINVHIRGAQLVVAVSNVRGDAYGNGSASCWSSNGR